MDTHIQGKLFPSTSYGAIVAQAAPVTNFDDAVASKAVLKFDASAADPVYVNLNLFIAEVFDGTDPVLNVGTTLGGTDLFEAVDATAAGFDTAIDVVFVEPTTIYVEMDLTSATTGSVATVAKYAGSGNIKLP